jgi:hypothetical protein
MDAIPKTPPRKPMYIGLFGSGTISDTTTVAPENIPADPIPAMARPMIKAVDDGAAPHRAEPPSKITIDTRKRSFVG